MNMDLDFPRKSVTQLVEYTNMFGETKESPSQK